MAEIQLIMPGTDLSDVCMTPMGWDTVIDGNKYEVYAVDGFVHTIGGRYGENNLWACPRDEKPTSNNLVRFNGEPCSWGVQVDEMNLSRTRWGDKEVNNRIRCYITRNGRIFYSISAGDIAYAFAEAYSLIRTAITEGPICFNRQNFVKEDIVGRHIMYKGNPYTMCYYNDGECTVFCVPGHVDIDDEDEYWRNFCHQDRDDAIRVDLLKDGHVEYV